MVVDVFAVGFPGAAAGLQGLVPVAHELLVEAKPTYCHLSH